MKGWSKKGHQIFVAAYAASFVQQMSCFGFCEPTAESTKKIAKKAYMQAHLAVEEYEKIKADELYQRKLRKENELRKMVEEMAEEKLRQKKVKVPARRRRA